MNAFTRLLSEFREGASLAELSTKLEGLVAAVRETGRKGKLTYTLMIRPASSGNEALVLLDEIEVKAPRADRDGAIFFATDENRLQRDNPKQMKLELREVEKPAAPEVKELPAVEAAAVAMGG
jgi:hypothetical protein